MADQITNGDVKSQVRINDKVKGFLWQIAATVVAAAIIGMIVMYGVSQNLSGKIEMLQTDMNMIKQVILVGKTTKGDQGDQGEKGATGKAGKDFWGK